MKGLREEMTFDKKFLLGRERVDIRIKAKTNVVWEWFKITKNE